MKKRVGAGFVGALVLPLIAVGILMMRAFDPYTRWAAAVVYAGGFVCLSFAIRRHQRTRDRVRRGRTKISGWLVENGRLLVAGSVLVGTGYAFFVLVPADEVEFIGVPDDVLRPRVDADLDVLPHHLRGIDHATDEHARLLASDAWATDPERKEALIRAWARYLDYAIALDRLVDRHKYFYQINPLEKADLNARSFLIGYASLLAQVDSVQRLKDIVRNRRDVETLLDEPRPEVGVGKNAYLTVTRALASPHTWLRVNAGRAHLKLVMKAGNLISDREKEVVANAKRRYPAIVERIGKQADDVLLDNPLDYFESKAFVAWYPVQKGVSEAISVVRTTGRDNFVSLSDLEAAREKLAPGDILLQRRNWYLTNVGLPGFWPHAALYTGSLEEIDDYFDDEAARAASNGKAPSEVVRSRWPRLAAAFLKPDDDGHTMRVIEAIGKGVVLQSLEHSGHADYLAALRPKLSKADRLAALLRAFEHHGKPYDFDFDFVTDDKVVCSELVYKAYTAPGDQTGLSFDLVRTTGRLVLPPTDIAQKFSEEHGTDRADLDFVLFYDGSEAQERAVERDVDAFVETWRRPKWDVAQE